MLENIISVLSPARALLVVHGERTIADHSRICDPVPRRDVEVERANKLPGEFAPCGKSPNVASQCDLAARSNAVAHSNANEGIDPMDAARARNGPLASHLKTREFELRRH